MANAIYFNDPKHQDEVLKDWMTPRYIVLLYELHREIVASSLGLNEDDRGKHLRQKDIIFDSKQIRKILKFGREYPFWPISIKNLAF